MARKNTEPYTFADMVRPASDNSDAYSKTWPPMKNEPMKKVSTYHSRRPQPRMLARPPVRFTWPRSAANTPIWQVNELATRTLVLMIANGTFSSAVWVSHRDGTPAAAAWALVTLRIVKYAANKAAKNISSDASQMITPTATGSGRSSRPRSRDCGIGCSDPAGLVSDPLVA